MRRSMGPPFSFWAAGGSLCRDVPSPQLNLSACNKAPKRGRICPRQTSARGFSRSHIMRCSGVTSKFAAFVVPAATLFVCSGPAFAHSHHSARHHHAYRHHVHYSNHYAARANALAAYGSLNSASFGSPYASAQTSFGGNRYARGSLYNVSAIDTGQAGTSGLPSSLIQ